MQSIERVVLLMFLLWSVVMPPVVEAAGCAYKKTFKMGAYVFTVASRPVDGCGVQVAQIDVTRGGKFYARYKTDADMVIESAWLSDLDKNGVPELVVVSRASGSGAYGALDVYYLEGNLLKRVSQPDLDDRNGYQGHDVFTRDGVVINRAFPVYRGNDTPDAPSGGRRTVTYTFGGNRLSVIEPPATAEPAAAATAPAPPAVAPAAVTNQPPPASSERIIVVDRTLPEEREQTRPQRIARKSSAKPRITAIVAEGSTIIIQSDKPLGRHKILKLTKPERVAIDISDATSDLSGKSVPLNARGITRARIGSTPGTLRVVFDTDLSSFPKYTFTAREAGLVLDLSE